MKCREYIQSTKLDLDSLKVNLVLANDDSFDPEQRSKEVIELVSQVIRLASKRGRVKKSDEGVFDVAA
ncbi:MAG: hypothetical protein AB7F59_14800 [Bdellovibrionales bacterium]